MMTFDATIDRLRYIGDRCQPTPEYGGFSHELRRIARAAEKHMRTERLKVRLLKKRVRAERLRARLAEHLVRELIKHMLRSATGEGSFSAQEHGDGDFTAFADKTGMPDNDRERVRYRARIIAGRSH